ncbi:MAG: sigma-70 family RNA polymerase sigma factor [Gaiellaceae bacterium]
MSARGIRPGEVDVLVAAATAGDEVAFSQLVDRYRRELQAHAYRIVRSHEESEDLMQETFLRAWRMRESFEGRSSFRAWLYRIATNASLSALERRSRRAQGDERGLIDEVASTDAEPEDELVSKETVELAFLAAVQHLPPRQRSVLVVRDVIGWSAKETAELLDMSVASVNSALQRARENLRRRLPRRRLEWASESDPSAQERAMLERILAATVRADADAIVALLHEEPATTVNV